jgi:hypothetical protein
MIAEIADRLEQKCNETLQDCEYPTFPNGDTSCWSAATLSPILSFFSCSIGARELEQDSHGRQTYEYEMRDANNKRTFGDTGDVLAFVFLGFFEVMLPNSSELVVVVVTAFPLK